MTKEDDEEEDSDNEKSRENILFVDWGIYVAMGLDIFVIEIGLRSLVVG